MTETRLTHTQNARPPTLFEEYGDPDVEWDIPPVHQADHLNALHDPGGSEMGDPSDASLAANIAARDNVTNDDFGDLQTWLLISAMFAFGLLIAVTAYLLPFGQHCTVPPIKVY